MHPIFQPQKEFGLYRVSDGAEHYSIREEGIFVVCFNSGKMTFATLVGAFIFYTSITEEATIFDISEPNKEVLVELKRYLN